MGDVTPVALTSGLTASRLFHRPRCVLHANQPETVAGVPVIDIAPLAGGVGHPGATAVGVALDEACSEAGFFYVVGHGVASELRARLDDLARQFFALREDEKALVLSMRAVHTVCDDAGDVATASLLENWIDQGQRRVWFLFEATRE